MLWKNTMNMNWRINHMSEGQPERLSIPTGERALSRG